MNEAEALQYDPFAGDFGEVGDRWLRNKMVTARKAGPCHECLGQIKPGERIRSLVALFSREVMSYRFCNACCHAMAACWTDNGKALEARWALRPLPYMSKN